MPVHRNRKGLDLPISGVPEQRIDDARASRNVALLGADHVGTKPTMHVRAGDAVSRGQLIFEDKKTPGVRFTAPAEGKVVAVNRGDKRAFQSLVIELSPAELGGRAAEARHGSYTGRPVEALDDDRIRELLLESGAWPALRQRPFGRVADPAGRPHSIFVTAMDSNPLAPSMSVVLEARDEDLAAGLRALAALTDGRIWVCADADTAIDIPQHERIRVERFRGPHPSGTAGWHIHRLDPVDRNKVVWYVGVQDVLAIGKLFRTGSLGVDRVISMAGPGVRNPRLLRTRIGASIDDLVDGELADGEQRVISGSVLSGRFASGDVLGYLGRYHQQVSVIAENRRREFLGWATPGADKFSVLPTFISKLFVGKRFAMDSSKNGSDRAIVPIGLYERVFPFDIPPSFLLRAIAVQDVEAAEQLGAMELEEEDLALCTFVDPGKDEFGPHLRGVLETLWSEG